MKRKRRFDNKKLGWLRFGKMLVAFIFVALLVFNLILGVSWVSGNSMLPTLHNGQVLISNRLEKEYEPGDIAAVRMPNGEYLVKRVIAVGGDTVDIKDGVVYINDLPESGYWVYGITEKAESGVTYPLTLSEGQIFALGDNRAVSVDSRVYGPLSATQTRGKILFVN